MDVKLIVVRPFGPHARGDVIEDAAEVARILADERRASVVRVVVGREGH